MEETYKKMLIAVVVVGLIFLMYKYRQDPRVTTIDKLPANERLNLQTVLLHMANEINSIAKTKQTQLCAELNGRLPGLIAEMKTRLEAVKNNYCTMVDSDIKAMTRMFAREQAEYGRFPISFGKNGIRSIPTKGVEKEFEGIADDLQKIAFMVSRSYCKAGVLDVDGVIDTFKRLVNTVCTMNPVDSIKGLQKNVTGVILDVFGNIEYDPALFETNFGEKDGSVVTDYDLIKNKTANDVKPTLPSPGASKAELVNPPQ